MDPIFGHTTCIRESCYSPLKRATRPAGVAFVSESAWRPEVPVKPSMNPSQCEQFPSNALRIACQAFSYPFPTRAARRALFRQFANDRHRQPHLRLSRMVGRENHFLKAVAQSDVRLAKSNHDFMP